MSSLALGTHALANGRFPRAERLIEHPSDPNQLVLAATYGLLTTRDRGANWYYVCESSFAHDPGYTGDPLIDFLGDGSLVVGVQTSMSVSGDQGCDWVPTLRDPNAFIVDDAIAKSDGSTIVAGVVVSGAGTVSNTLQESLDGGRTWTTIGTPLPLSVLASIDIDPTDPRHLYATGLAKDQTGQFLSSIDHGTTWSVHSIPSATPSAIPYLAGILPSDSNRIFVRTDASSEVTESGDALLYSDDGGVTFRELHRSRARLLGFALSPDGSSVMVGYGDPGPGGPAGLPGPFGIFESSTAQFAFEQVYAGRVNCITWTKTGVYVCSNETRDGFELAFSADPSFGADGGCLVPILHRNEVRGALDCGPDTSGAACAADWSTSCVRLGACSNDAGPRPAECVPSVAPTTDSDGAGAGGSSATNPDASSGAETGTAPVDDGGGDDEGADAEQKGSGCSCRTSGQATSNSAALGAALLLGTLFALRRGRRPFLRRDRRRSTRAPASSRMPAYSIERTSNS